MGSLTRRGGDGETDIYIYIPMGKLKWDTMVELSDLTLQETNVAMEHVHTCPLIDDLPRKNGDVP